VRRFPELDSAMRVGGSRTHALANSSCRVCFDNDGSLLFKHSNRAAHSGVGYVGWWRGRAESPQVEVRLASSTERPHTLRRLPSSSYHCLFFYQQHTDLHLLDFPPCTPVPVLATVAVAAFLWAQTSLPRRCWVHWSRNPTSRAAEPVAQCHPVRSPDQAAAVEP
jgi:hypothetical protein